jgi:hypothetical protein
MISEGDEILEMNRIWFNESWLSEYSTLLRSGIWHLTSPLGISGIKQSGYIKPNSGTRDYTFPQSENSYGKLKQYVCLFDFCTVDINEFIFTFDRWSCFFRQHKPFTVALKLNHEYLVSYLIQNQVAREEVGYKKVWILYVEVWYPGEIPISTIDSYFVIPVNRKSEFIEVKGDELIEFVDDFLQSTKDKV